ncbi:hypothetical protein JTB14_025074 [Gonioctena quinquepunctata]|nr:hypothetical protein JTB14_025074 [Gonioctena quinquepunctata]
MEFGDFAHTPDMTDVKRNGHNTTSSSCSGITFLFSTNSKLLMFYFEAAFEYKAAMNLISCINFYKTITFVRKIGKEDVWE